MNAKWFNVSFLSIAVLLGLSACGGSGTELTTNDSNTNVSTSNNYFNANNDGNTFIVVNNKKIAIVPNANVHLNGGSFLSINGSSIGNSKPFYGTVSGFDRAGIRFGVVKDGDDLYHFAIGHQETPRDEMPNAGSAQYSVSAAITRNGEFSETEQLKHQEITANFADKTVKGMLGKDIKIDAVINGNVFSGHGTTGGFVGDQAAALIGTYHKDNVHAAFGGVKE